MASNNNVINEEKKRLVFSILEMLQKDMEGINGEGERQKGETLEVVIQCLSEVYEVQLESDAHKYKTDASLETSFQGMGKGPVGSSMDNPLDLPSGGATPEDRAAAEEHKREGNEHMKKKEFELAVTAYSKAIERNDEKAEYYCNRAAAYSKVGQHERAVDDCLLALGLKEDYARAHGRLGFAYYQMGKHAEAKKAYKRALELEPDNAGYKHNMESLERTLKDKETPPSAPSVPSLPPSTSQPPPANPNQFGGSIGGQVPNFAGFPGLGPMGGGQPNLGGFGGLPNLPAGMDLGSLMGNPAFMNMATQMMSDPNMMNMATQFASQMQAQGGNPMGGFMNPGMFAPQQPPQNPPQGNQQQPPPPDKKDEKKNEKKDENKDQDKQ